MTGICRKALTGVLAALLIAVVAGCSHTPTSSVSVADAQAAADGTYVVIDARISQKLSDERFLVRDITGEIIAEIDEDIMGEVQVSPDATLRLYGEISRDSRESVLEVERVQVLR